MTYYICYINYLFREQNEVLVSIDLSPFDVIMVNKTSNILITGLYERNQPEPLKPKCLNFTWSQVTVWIGFSLPVIAVVLTNLSPWPSPRHHDTCWYKSMNRMFVVRHCIEYLPGKNTICWSISRSSNRMAENVRVVRPYWLIQQAGMRDLKCSLWSIMYDSLIIDTFFKQWNTAC
jgi:hypothetical protein